VDCSGAWIYRVVDHDALGLIPRFIPNPGYFPPGSAGC
jgi:hypothetical protein